MTTPLLTPDFVFAFTKFWETREEVNTTLMEAMQNMFRDGYSAGYLKGLQDAAAGETA